MSENLKVFLIKSWIIGAVVVIVYFMLHLQHFFIGLILGLVNTGITDPIINAIVTGNKTRKLTHKAIILSTLKNISIAVLFSLIIRGIDYLLLINKIVTMPIEPFRFIIMFQAMYYGNIYIYKVLFKRKGENHEL